MGAFAHLDTCGRTGDDCRRTFYHVQRERGSRVANTKSAIKRIRTSEKRRLRNRAIRSSVRTAIKKFERALGQVEREESEALLRYALRKLDKAVTKGVLHRNTAARKKSR